MIKVYEINDLSNHKVIEILKKGISENIFKNEKLLKNYLYSHKENPANLFCLLKNGRYKNGSYFVIVDENDNLIAGSGWYPYNNDTALVLTRMLVVPKYRTSYVVGHKVLPTMIQKTMSYKNVWITCNDYNKSIYNFFLRSQENRSTTIHKNWPEIYKNFKPIGQHTVNGILQYVAALEK